MAVKPRVLYIDDDAGICRLAEKDLTRHGYVVETAADGEQGLAKLRQSSFDVIALDHHMPGRSGLEILPLIKELSDPPPVIFVTGEAEGRIAIAALKAGAVDYVIKELHGEFFALLRVALAAALESRDLRRMHEKAEAEVRAARDRFEALANERAILIQEVNHRVGNSLQLVASLLNMQASAHPDRAVKEALATATGRVIAVSQVHRRLYTSDDVQSVALDQYLGSLVEDLARAVEGEEAHRDITFRHDPVETRPDRAVAVGVMMTEMVLNAIKYAYPNGGGPVRVSGVVGDDLQVSLTVEDDGIGSSASEKPVGTGLGRRIIQALSSKLGASVTQDPTHAGTSLTIRFPALEPPVAAE
jgi:two-component sensor histidine kinase